jgi:predicted XRE-type DNA-binding protein
MRVKKVANSEHGAGHLTPAGRSVFYDLFTAEKAAEMEMRAQLLMGLEHWLEKSRMTQAEAAKVLGVTRARVSDLKRARSTDSVWTCWYGWQRAPDSSPS